MVLMRKNFQILQSDWWAIQNWIVFFYCDDLDSLNCAFNRYLRFVSNQISFLFFLLADSFWGDLKINSLYKDPTYTGKRACLMPFFVNAFFCSKIRRYDCHVFIPEMIPNYAWSPLHLFFVTRTSLGLIWDKCGWRTVGFGSFLYDLNTTLISSYSRVHISSEKSFSRCWRHHP